MEATNWEKRGSEGRVEVSDTRCYHRLGELGERGRTGEHAKNTGGVGRIRTAMLTDDCCILTCCSVLPPFP